MCSGKWASTMTDGGPYTLNITDEAEDDLKRLDKTAAKRIVKRVKWLAANAGEIDHHALAGQWGGLFRLRVGDFRVIYDLNHTARSVTIVEIGHRREVYGD